MNTYRSTLLALLLTLSLCGTNAANAGVSVNLHIGAFPTLVPVPGYPVYYAPQLSANFFFYDGSYWLFEEGQWYASDWYDGPWEYVDPYYVPAFVLRVPVRYYRVPAPWFRGGYYLAPPRWGHYWGPGWSQHRHGWEHGDRYHAPRREPQPERHQQPQREWNQGRQREPRPDQARQPRQEQFRQAPRPRPEHQMKPQQWQARQTEAARHAPRQDWQQGRGEQMRGRDAGHRQNEGHRERSGRPDGRGRD